MSRYYGKKPVTEPVVLAPVEEEPVFIFHDEEDTTVDDVPVDDSEDSENDS